MTQAIISQSYTQHDLAAITSSTAKLHLTPLIPKPVQPSGKGYSLSGGKVSGSSSGVEGDHSPIVIKTSKRWILPPRPRPGKKTITNGSRTSSESSLRRSSISKALVKQHSSGTNSKAKGLSSSKTALGRSGGSNGDGKCSGSSTKTNFNDSERSGRRDSASNVPTKAAVSRRRSVSSSSKSNTTASSTSTVSKSRKSSGKVVKAQIPKDVDDLSYLAFLNFDDTADLSLDSPTFSVGRRSSNDSQITRTGTPPEAKAVSLPKTSSKVSGRGTAAAAKATSQNRKGSSLPRGQSKGRTGNSKAPTKAVATDPLASSTSPQTAQDPMDIILDMSLPLDLNFHLDVPMELQGVSPGSETVVSATPVTADAGFPSSKFFGTDVSVSKLDEDFLSSGGLNSRDNTAGNGGNDKAGLFPVSELEAIDSADVAVITEHFNNKDDSGVEMNSEDELYNSIWELLPRYTDDIDNKNIQDRQLSQQGLSGRGQSSFQRERQHLHQQSQLNSTVETLVLAPTLDELMEEQDNFMDLFNDSGEPDFGNSGSGVGMSVNDFDFDLTEVGSL